MRKTVIFIAAAVALVAAFALAGFAFAQDENPPVTPEPGYGPRWGGRFGPGMMGGYGPMGGFRNGGTPGSMHTAMHAALAEALGLTPEAFEERLANGETPWQIAEAQGLTQDEFHALMLEARAQAIEQLVAEGVITQAQADWMLRHMQPGRPGYGPGNCPMHPQTSTTPTAQTRWPQG